MLKITDQQLDLVWRNVKDSETIARINGGVTLIQRFIKQLSEPEAPLT